MAVRNHMMDVSAAGDNISAVAAVGSDEDDHIYDEDDDAGYYINLFRAYIKGSVKGKGHSLP